MRGSGESGRLSGDDLLRELRDALDNASAGDRQGFATLDYRRQSRTGTPEIILAEHKSDAQV
ncbi:MAG: hypothetical protein WD401_03450, partial [Thermomicrobiaceae bacterium]